MKGGTPNKLARSGSSGVDISGGGTKSSFTFQPHTRAVTLVFVFAVNVSYNTRCGSLVSSLLRMLCLVATTFSADVYFLFSLSLSLPLNLLLLPERETFSFCLLHNLLRFIARLHSLDKSRDSEVRPPLLSSFFRSFPPSAPCSGSSQTISGLRKESVYSAAEACWNHAVFPLAETHCCHSMVCIFSCITRL